MTRTELVEELERLLGEAAVARERLEGVVGTVRALRQTLPAPASTPPPEAPETAPPPPGAEARAGEAPSAPQARGASRDNSEAPPTDLPS